MKQGIHPDIHTNAVIKCACGSTFETISTQPSISVEICSECHPFYTGQQKFVDTEGRIDKFVKKQKVAAEKKKVAAEVKKAKAAKKPAAKKSTGAPSLKDMLEQARKSS